MKKLLVVFCLATTAITYAQPYQNATPIIQTLSTNVATIPQGQFSIRSAFKFADGTDTIRNQGTCYFFKHEKNPDSLAQFVVFENDKPMYAYDGELF
ncbi:MAG: hypothetical protein JNJ57_12125 [Saprospiraceae bacterium]|nr:hypothetical protein [Saprospiraceae bacterium]